MNEDKYEKCCICDTSIPDGGVDGVCYPCWEYDRTLPPFRDLRTVLEETAIAESIRKKEGN